jgi:hypothetical protein
MARVDLALNKYEAARRQLNAAIRMLFRGDDILAVHSVAYAAFNLLRELAISRGVEDSESRIESALQNAAVEVALKQLYERAARTLNEHGTPGKMVIEDRNALRHSLAEAIPADLLKQWKKNFYRTRNYAGNFLKHGDRDEALRVTQINTEDILLEACVLYVKLGHTLTPEMHIFGQWHLGVYPSAEGDEIQLSDGTFLHDLSREAQLAAGAWRLRQFDESEFPVDDSASLS